MSRKHPGRKIRQAIERYRRNVGPMLFSRAADEELKTKATQMAGGLSGATIAKGSAAAAGLLVELAEAAEYSDNPAAFDRAFSLADKWAGEPQVVPIDIVRPLLEDQPQPLQLTAGQKDDPDAAAAEAADGAHDPPGSDPEPTADPEPTGPEPIGPEPTAPEPATAGSIDAPGPRPPAKPEIVEAIYE